MCVYQPCAPYQYSILLFGREGTCDSMVRVCNRIFAEVLDRATLWVGVIWLYDLAHLFQCWRANESEIKGNE